MIPARRRLHARLHHPWSAPALAAVADR